MLLKPITLLFSNSTLKPLVYTLIVQGQLLKIWHRMLIYHTMRICGPYEVNFRKIIVGHFSNDL